SVATYYGETESLDFTGVISWPGGSPPKDQPICGFDGSLCPRKTGMALSTFLCVLAVSEWN
ncbi:hypothetical protein SK128_021876, partial [Halocaridina rubra]